MASQGEHPEPARAKEVSPPSMMFWQLLRRPAQRREKRLEAIAPELGAALREKEPDKGLPALKE